MARHPQQPTVVGGDSKNVKLTDFMKALGQEHPVAADSAISGYTMPYDDNPGPTMVINIETNLWRDTKSGAYGSIYDLAHELTGSCNMSELNQYMVFLTESLHKVSEFHILYVNADNRRLLWVTCHCRKFLALLILVHILQDEVTRIHVEIGIHLQGGEVDDVATMVSGVVVPSVCIGIDHQHRLRVVALRRIVELHIPESLDRLFAESSHELRQRYVLDVILCVPHRLKLVFEGVSHRRTKMSRVIAENKPLLYVRSESHMVREIDIGRQRYRTAIYESIFRLDNRAIGQ